MSKLKLKVTGNYKRTKNFLSSALRRDYLKDLDSYGKEGVAALRANTPYDTGRTAESWDYEIVREDGKVTIYWKNSNVQGDDCNIAVILQYGHATKNGGWVEGVDYINPALKPIFEKIANNAWLRLKES